MPFYEELSRYYDEIFTANAQEMRFVNGLLAEARSVLDIGCGTGNKTEHFAQPRRRVIGFDLDAGMIAQAREKHAGENIEYLVLDMMDMAGRFGAGGFDAVLCLGNTLAHLTEPGALAEMLGQTGRVLTKDGLFVTQILNYDRILDQGVTALPRIETPQVTFIRRYEWRDGDMHFLTDLRVADGENYHNDIVLRPLRQTELAEALNAAGFGRVEYYGGYDGAAYTAESFHLIAAARR